MTVLTTPRSEEKDEEKGGRGAQTKHTQLEDEDNEFV